MRSIIKFLYHPNGNLERIDTGPNHNQLFQGGVGTALYILEMAEANNENNWLPTDNVHVAFERPDGAKANPSMMYLGGAWQWQSNGWETDVNIVSNNKLKVNFVAQRESMTQVGAMYMVQPTEQKEIIIMPTAGYVPGNITITEAENFQFQLSAFSESLQEMNDYIDEFKQRVADGEFKGATGPQGIQGPEGIQGPLGTKIWLGATPIVNEGGLINYPVTDLAAGSHGEPITGDIIFSVANGGYGTTFFVADGIISIIYRGNISGPKGDKGDKGDTGPQGAKGNTGEPFAIKKTYISIAAMNANFLNDLLDGQFALIEANDVENPDNSKLYVRNGNQMTYVTDLSGARGFQGPQGEAGPVGPAGPQGATGDTGPQGAKGDKGDTGDAGKDGLNGTKMWFYEGMLGAPSDGVFPYLDIDNIINPFDSTPVLASQLTEGDYVIATENQNAGYIERIEYETNQIVVRVTMSMGGTRIHLYQGDILFPDGYTRFYPAENIVHTNSAVNRENILFSLTNGNAGIIDYITTDQNNKRSIALRSIFSPFKNSGDNTVPDCFYFCNGVNDNEILSQMAADFIADSNPESNLLYIKAFGVFGAGNPVTGTGTIGLPFTFIQALNTSDSGKHIVFDMQCVDFTKAKYEFTQEGYIYAAFAKLQNCEFLGDVAFYPAKAAGINGNVHVQGLSITSNSSIHGSWNIKSNYTLFGLYGSSNNKLTGNWSLSGFGNGPIHGLDSSNNNEIIGSWKFISTSSSGGITSGLSNSANNLIKGNWSLTSATTAIGLYNLSRDNRIAGSWLITSTSVTGHSYGMDESPFNNIIKDGTWIITSSATSANRSVLLNNSSSCTLQNLKIVVLSRTNYATKAIYSTRTSASTKYIIRDCEFVHGTKSGFNTNASQITAIDIGTSENIQAIITGCVFHNGFSENVTPVAAENKVAIANNIKMNLTEAIS